MRRRLILYSLISGGLLANAQESRGIRHAYAFITEHLPGNIAVDPNGRPLHRGPDTLTTVYLETCLSGVIHWEKAWKNGNSFSVQSIPIPSQTADVGIRKADSQKVTLTPAKGCKLWRLELVPDDSPVKQPVKTHPGEIILRGEYGHRTILQRINNVTEIVAPPSV